MMIGGKGIPPPQPSVRFDRRDAPAPALNRAEAAIVGSLKS